MESEIIKTAIESGIWVMLTIALISYVLKETEEREDRYQRIINNNQNTIKELTEKLNIITDIQANVCDIKKNLQKKE